MRIANRRCDRTGAAIAPCGTTPTRGDVRLPDNQQCNYSGDSKLCSLVALDIIRGNPPRLSRRLPPSVHRQRRIHEAHRPGVRHRPPILKALPSTHSLREGLQRRLPLLHPVFVFRLQSQALSQNVSTVCCVVSNGAKRRVPPSSGLPCSARQTPASSHAPRAARLACSACPSTIGSCRSDLDRSRALQRTHQVRQRSRHHKQRQIAGVRTAQLMDQHHIPRADRLLSKISAPP